jgi:outer membrane protein
MSLEDCIGIVLDRNPEVLVARDEIRAAEAQKKVARSEFFFKAKTQYSYTRLDETPVLESFDIPSSDGEIETGTINNWSWQTTLTQPLFTGFRILTGFDLAKLGIDVAQASFEIKKIELVFAAKEAYYNLLRAEKGLIVAKTAVTGFEAQAKTANDFYEVGMTPKNDSLKAEVEAANARHNLTKAENLIEVRRAQLNNLLRFPVEAKTRVVDSMGYSPFEKSFDECLDQALIHRPDVRRAGLNVDVAEKNVKLAQSDYYPTLALMFDYKKKGDEWTVDGSDFEDAEDWSFTAGLEWTFWEWGRTFYDASEKKVRVLQSKEIERQVREAVALEIKNAYLNLREAEKNIPVTQKTIDQAEENLRMASERYKEQVTTNTEVLDAQTLLSQAQDNYYNALYDYNIALAQLKAAMGLLD